MFILDSYVHVNEISQITQSAIFRSKATWVKEGEKNSKYFFSLEKRNFLNKNMTAVRTENGCVYHDQQSILNEQTKFFSNLYQRDNKVAFTLKPSPGEVLVSEADKEWLDKEYTEEELYTSLTGMKNDKTPGLDGLPKEFYVKFWSYIKLPLIENYAEAVKNNRLNNSARKGLITLIPKKNRNLLLLNSWRPLTMLNLDYKILAKALAERMKRVLKYLICEEQTGFMKDRYIAENIRRCF